MIIMNIIKLKDKVAAITIVGIMRFIVAPRFNQENTPKYAFLGYFLENACPFLVRLAT
jgi:hypothetical protein